MIATTYWGTRVNYVWGTGVNTFHRLSFIKWTDLPWEIITPKLQMGTFAEGSQACKPESWDRCNSGWPQSLICFGLAQGFSTLGLTTLVGGSLGCVWGGSPVHCRIFLSLYPLDVRNPLLPCHDIQNCPTKNVFWHYPMSPRSHTCPQLKTICLEKMCLEFQLETLQMPQKGSKWFTDHYKVEKKKRKQIGSVVKNLPANAGYAG